MTSQAFARVAVKPGMLPDAYSPVLLNRDLRLGTSRAEMSVFGDDRWNLSPAIFENHLNAVSLNFQLVPERFRHFAKIYIWLELNCDEGQVILRRASIEGLLAVYTMVSQLRVARTFLTWLDERGFPTVSAVTPEDLGQFLKSVQDAEMTHGHRCDVLQAVRRIWAFRDMLPPEGRLPEMPPWGGKDSRILLGKSERHAENRTPRISEATMAMTLFWALRFVQDLSDDLVAVMDEARPLTGLQPGRLSQRGRTGLRDLRTGGRGSLAPHVDDLIAEFRRTGRPLPGRIGADGSLELDWPFLAKLLDCTSHGLKNHGGHDHRFRASGLSIALGDFLAVQPTGQLDGKPWMARFRNRDARTLTRMLSTACFIVICYLTGMRPGEALNLRRGCAGRNKATQLWEINGLKWKGAVDENGAKIPEGQHRDDPWIAAEVVALAVSVQERLHDGDMLFPASLLVPNQRKGKSRSFSPVNDDLNDFVAWVNAYCKENGRNDGIPVDGHRITARRFRRTLAWFICRRPRGLVAAAIQYGHLQVQITQGYAGTYASGFPDDMAFERWLARLDELEEADRRLKNGANVSGPAADAYRSRVTGGCQKFAGRVLRTAKEARHILANPSLQIYPGKGMTCVFAAATALCELSPGLDDARYTPDIDDCRPGCLNIVRTEDNIDELRAEAGRLRLTVDDEASPPIRLQRERQRLTYLEKIIDGHTGHSA
ncbi:hypothetical protein ACFWBC_06370 [Streptomyces sp. NPDC059985]|uniref:hypothetical protein n=1 Tax=Streptomyces sp. NPDC059985 TaxID=3347025 RepID=UPI0036A52DF0